MSDHGGSGVLSSVGNAQDLLGVDHAPVGASGTRGPPGEPGQKDYMLESLGGTGSWTRGEEEGGVQAGADLSPRQPGAFLPFAFAVQALEGHMGPWNRDL